MHQSINPRRENIWDHAAGVLIVTEVKLVPVFLFVDKVLGRRTCYRLRWRRARLFKRQQNDCQSRFLPCAWTPFDNAPGLVLTNGLLHEGALAAVRKVLGVAFYKHATFITAAQLAEQMNNEV